MGVDPINIELTEFNKLDLLRDEEERLGEELAGLEKSIRSVLLAAAHNRFLSSLSPYYGGKGPGQADVAQIQKQEAQRQLVAAALDAVRSQREVLEQSLGPSSSRALPGRRAPRPAGGSKTSNFDSFENFRQSQPPKE